ncbi:MAG: pyridoxal 5'-phosphate synthase glutaminase subunit PdxT [Candidatus Altiarchaeota archaeon]|nr:pyridoxal 5'-phosphate synthase glutaminase subunit PdxT [Candidatus Altiarchaeota archaeon]
MKIGILSLQGDVSEHVHHTRQAMKDLSIRGDVYAVKNPDEVRELDALIIPGGESTTILKLLKEYGVDREIKNLAKKKVPIMGTCAGLILLSNLGLMDIAVSRNAFGRQRESFEVDLKILRLGKEPYHAVFIRAPVIEKTGKGVEVLAEYDNRVIMAQQGNLLAVAFHPELTSDTRLIRYFLSLRK